MPALAALNQQLLHLVALLLPSGHRFAFFKVVLSKGFSENVLALQNHREVVQLFLGALSHLTSSQYAYQESSSLDNLLWPMLTPFEISRKLSSLAWKTDLDRLVVLRRKLLFWNEPESTKSSLEEILIFINY